MANRQALRELQARLAERLKALEHTQVAQGASWLAVQVGGKNYLLPLEQAGEIFPWTAISPVPYTKPWFLGVANLRGSLVGVVDFGTYLGRAVERAAQSVSERSLLHINPALQVNTAVVVDRLLGLRGHDDFIGAGAEQAVVPGDGQEPQRAVFYTDSEGIVWEVLQLQDIAQAADFLNIRI